MSSTTGSPYYQSRSMNGYYFVTDGSGNSLDAIAQKVTNIFYDDTTNTTSIIQNTDLNTVKVDSITFPDNSTLTSAYIPFPEDVSFNNVDISNNLNTTRITFPDNSYFTTANIPLPDDASFNNVDVSNNINTNTIHANSITFSDGSSFSSANYKFFIPPDLSLNSLYVTTDISCQNLYANEYVYAGNALWSDTIVNTTQTAMNAIGFPYTQNTYSFQYITGTPQINDFVEPTQPNMPTGIQSGFQLTAFDLSGTLTFNSNSMSNTAQMYQAVDAYAPKTNEIYAYDFSASMISLGSGITMSGITSSVKPFVNSYNAYFGSYYVTTPLNNLTTSGNTTVIGYFKTANSIVSNDTFFTSRYLTASTNIIPPTRITAQTGKLINIESKNTVTPSTSSGSITGIIISSNQISYTANTSAINDFVGSGQQDGITVSAIDISNHILTIANGTLSTAPVANGTVYGYVSSGNTIQTYDASGVTVGSHVNGLGVSYDIVSSKTATALTLQRSTATIATPIKSYYGYVDTNQIITNSTIDASQNFVTQAGLPIPTKITNQTGVFVNISSPSVITDSTKNNFQAVSFNGNKLAYLSTVASVGHFVASSNGLYDVSAGCTITDIDTSANNQIITLSQTDVLPSQPQFYTRGYISGTNKITLTSNSGVATNRYLYDTSGILIPFGRNYISYFDGSGCNVYNNGLTPTISSGTFYGYIKTGGTVTATLITNDSFGTGINPDFITGAGFAGTGYFGSSGTGSTRNLTVANSVTATATTSTTFTGFIWDTANILYVSITGSGIGAFYSTGTIAIPEASEQDIATDTTNQLIHVNKTLKPATSANYIKEGYALSSTTIQVYDTTNIAVNQFIKSSYTTNNKPYITAVNTTTKVITLAGSVSTQSPAFTPSGYILNPTTLLLTNTQANSTAIANTTFVTGTGLGQPSQIYGYDASTNLYTIKSPNTISPSTPAFIGYGVIISSVGYNTLITNNTVARTNVNIQCYPLIDYGSFASSGQYQFTLSYNTKTTASTINTYSGAFYEGYYITEPANALTTGGLLTDSSNPYTKYVFNTGRLTTQGTGGKYGVSSGIGVVNSTPILSSNREWIVASATEIAYQIGATGTPAINQLLYASDNTYVTGSKITAITNATYRILQCTGRSFTVPAVATQYTTVSPGGTNTTRILLSASPANVVIGQYIRIGATGPILGVKVTAKQLIGAFSVDIDTAVTYGIGVIVYFFNGNTASSFNVVTPISTTFYEPTAMLIYNPVSFNVYTNNNFNLYNSITITNWSPTLYTKYASFPVSITAPAQYSSIVPLLYNEITSSPYSLYNNSNFLTYTPVQIKMWNNQTCYFYNPQYINLIRKNVITIPTTRIDAITLCNYPQTLTNKTLTTPVINTPTITNANITNADISGNLNLFGYQFRFVDWTQAYSSLSQCLVATTQPSFASTGSVFYYYYSVVGNTMYVEFSYFQATGGTAGTGNYLIKLPSGYTSNTNQTRYLIETAPAIWKGVPIGYHSTQAYGNTNHVGSVSTNSAGTHFMLLYEMAWGNSVWTATYYSLTTSNLHVGFNATVPLL